MKPHLATFASWGVYALAEAILVAVILYKGAAKRWPFLLAVTLFDLAHSALLYSVIGDCTRYFDIFWWGQGVRALISLGVLCDIARAVPGLRYIPKRIGLFVATLAVTIAAGSVLITLHSHPHGYSIDSQALLVRECVSIAWVCLILCFLGSISTLNMGWLEEGVNITAGFVASGLTAMTAASAMRVSPQYHTMIDLIQTTVDIAVLAYWSVTLCRNSVPDEDSSDYVLAVINEILGE